MKENFITVFNNFWQVNVIGYIQKLQANPVRLIPLIIDLVIVIFLLYKFIKYTKNTRVWQLIKGIAVLIIITALSGWLKLDILNYLLTSVMTYGVIVLIVIFQPELRRGLEQLGTNKLTKFFGIDKNIETKTKEDIYKIAIAAQELSKSRTGALIVIERDIKIGDIAETGIILDAEVSPQLLVNIFVPKTPLHDGAVVISNNRIQAAACILPLANDKQIAKELGTRHRAAIGISKETDAVAVVVSEETGKISLAKDGTLIADLEEDNLKKILIKSIVTSRYSNQNKIRKQRIKNMKNKFGKQTKSQNSIKNTNDLDNKKDQ